MQRRDGDGALPLALDDRLTATLGRRSVLQDNEDLKRYARDWSHAPACPPRLVIRPSTALDLAAAIRICGELDMPVVTQGGRTGLSGGATPRRGEVAISLERMTRVLEVDADEMVMIAEAGVPLVTAQEAAAEHKLMLPIDLAARGTATLGGLAATNAGGHRVLRYGTMKDLVLGIEAVLADGTIAGGLNRLIKNNAGYDLAPLFLGTEGTLGIITRLALKLVPIPAQQMTVACACGTFGDVVELLTSLRHCLGPGLEAFEVLWADYQQHVSAHHTDLRLPFGTARPYLVLVEVAGISDETIPPIEPLLATLLQRGTIEDAIVPRNESQRTDLWEVREAAAEILAALPTGVGFDVSLPLRHIGDVASQLTATVQEHFPGSTTLTFGHLGDGNLHLTVAPPNSEDRNKVERLVLEQISAAGGSITGEHGIGRLKRQYLSLCRSDTDIAVMRRMKAALDPQSLLNPARVLPSQ